MDFKKFKRIAIIGNGGIGSNLVVPLMKFLKTMNRMGYNHPVDILICDGDIVEKKNLERQDFVLSDIKSKKAKVTADFLSSSHPVPNVDVYPIAEYIKEENLDFVGDGTVLFVGVDNYVTRKVIEDAIKKIEGEVLVIFGGNEYDDGDVNVIHKTKEGFQTPLYSQKHPEINKRDRFPDEIGCEEAAKISSPQLIFANMTVANYMLEAFYEWVTNKIQWHEKMFDLKTGNVRVVK